MSQAAHQDTAGTARPRRPISPHLTVYRPLIGAFTSILHRAMNTVLFIGCFFLALWLLAVARGGAFYAFYNGLLGSVIGKALLFGWTFAAAYSAAQTIRHLFWDLGYGFELRTARRSAWAALVGAALFSLAYWLVVALR